MTKLGRLAEISGQEALQQAVQHTTGGLRTGLSFEALQRAVQHTTGGLRIGLIFKCGDVEESH